MNAAVKIAAGPRDPLAKLREPFPPHQVSKLPKETKAQAEQRKADQDKGNWPARCSVCGGLHHKNAVHLDYVGHAALTDRLLDTDPTWSWEPLAYRDGLPAFDANGGLWIKLTVCGVTRLGYGNAGTRAGMDVGAREKEVIGDALRNAGMRFGAALDLWHKGDLHVDDGGSPDESDKSATTADTTAKTVNTVLDAFIASMKMNKTREKVVAWATREANAIGEKLNKPDQNRMQDAFEAWLIECDKAAAALADSAKSTTATKSLADRASIFESAMRDCKDQAALRRTYETGQRLRDDLDKSDPERLAELNSLYEDLFTKMDRKVTEECPV